MNCDIINPLEVKKKLFKLKPLRNDGLLFKVHHTTGNSKIRFLYGCFHHFQNILAAANNQGTIYVIDYSLCKFWCLPNFDSCTVVEFSPRNDKHLLVGLKTGNILICDIDSGNILFVLPGHKFEVKSLSFSKLTYCLSASKTEAFIWDLETVTKTQVLNLKFDCSLKYISFVPFSGKIVACFQDDVLQVWSHEKYDVVKQFSPRNWKNYLINSITFTRNGEFMVVSGHVPTLVVTHLGTSKILKTINLSDYLITVKHAEFVSQVFDGGCNKILGILSGQGVIYFFDMEHNEIVSELRCSVEINKFVCSPDGTNLVCLLSSGEIEVFDIKQYLIPPEEIRIHKVRKRLKINRKRCLNDVRLVKQEIENMLDIKKLKLILKEHFEYPEAFRMKIWEVLMQLPNNLYKYNSIINHVTLVAFDNLYERYPLEDKLFIKGLKRLLNNLVTWCPFFAYVDFLPVFAFPFVKVFYNKPLTCFEAVCTVILNWCQHWFEYFPLAPVNVLGIAENLLLEHDPELLIFFTGHQVTSNVYIWSLLETVFSEVLTSSEWLIMWDHILTNEVAFLLSAVVAYNVVQRSVIMALKNAEDFEVFFKNQNPIDMKRFIKISYCIMKTTSEKFHPRQYLNKFAPMGKGNYPLFIEYPKKMVQIKTEQMEKLDNHMINLLVNEQSLASKENDSKVEGISTEIVEEEKRRLRDQENLFSREIESQKCLVRDEEKHLKKLHRKMKKRGREADAYFDHILSSSVDRYENPNSVHKEKLLTAMNLDLLSRFIKKLEIDLKDKEQPNRSSNDIDDKNQHSKEFQPIQNYPSSSHDECKFHSSGNCPCGLLCPKTVRFTSSTTGGSNEDVS